MKYLFLLYWAIYFLAISGFLLAQHFAFQKAFSGTAGPFYTGYTSFDFFWLDNIADISFALNSLLTIMLVVVSVRLINKDKWSSVGLLMLSYVAFWGLYASSPLIYLFISLPLFYLFNLIGLI